MTIKFGDDLLCASNKQGGYSKVNDDEYYFTEIYFPYIQNGNNVTIESGKYQCELWIRQAGSSEYILYSSFTNNSYGRTWWPKKADQIVGYYFLIKDMEESLKCTSRLQVKFTSPNIPETGTLHNFTYIQVYFKDTNGNLVLQNEPALDSYDSFIAKEEIATFDQETYGTYMQRATASTNWIYYDVKLVSDIKLSKTSGTISQDAENEQFTGRYKLTTTIESDIWHVEYFNYTTPARNEDKINGFILYDLLPLGMKLTSTPEEIIQSTAFDTGYQYWNLGTYARKADGTPFETVQSFISFIRENTSVEILENYNNTGRTLLKIVVDVSHSPICCFSRDSYPEYPCKISFSFNYSIPYDSFLEFGNVWKNYAYLEYINPNENNEYYSYIRDDGRYDADATDINNNGNILDYLASGAKSITINSLASTHQDVTTYVKTDQSHYSTGTVNSSCDSEYEYKLRVRTGASNITNLIIYTNLEEAQQGRQRWKGNFLSLNTTYAENKGYIVKPYYSENPKAGNLYKEDGTLNSDWKEYIPDTPEIIANGLAITFDENFKTYNSSDYLYIYYNYDGQLYRTYKYYGTDLVNKTIELPSTDIYFSWNTDSYSNNYYGFKVVNIEPKVVTTTIGSSGHSLPTNTPIELTENNYPETNHNPYGNNERILWHYIYTGNLILQEYVEHIPKDSVKSLAFEYLDLEGNPAILPANSLTYVLINMKSPADESITTLARMDCRTQWNALDEFDRPVDFITGINSNVVKIALPNSIDEDSIASISLKFTKEITSTESQFENMKFNINSPQTFMIRLTSLTANEDGSYNQITALLRSDQELIISQIPIGTYLLEELGDNYFDFVDFTDNNDPEIIISGITFERTDQGYIITVSEDLTETVEFNIKVTNEIEPERFYEDKNNKENLFLINKINNGMMDPDDPQGH